MLTKIRHNLEDIQYVFDNMFDEDVQVDETYIGGKTKGKIWQNKT